MTYEYLTVGIDTTSRSEDQDLSEYGREGWRVVCALPNQYSTRIARFLLERPVRQPSAEEIVRKATTRGQ